MGKKILVSCLDVIMIIIVMHATTFLVLKDRIDLPSTLWWEGSEVNELLTDV